MPSEDNFSILAVKFVFEKLLVIINLSNTYCKKSLLHPDLPMVMILTGIFFEDFVVIFKCVLC